MSADDCLTPELFSLALAAHRLERHLNPASVPFDAPMLDRRQFLVGQPVDTMLALGGIRKLLDEIYQHYGWQKMCVMPAGQGLPLMARGVAGLRPGVGDELSAWGDALRPSDAIVGDMVASLAAWVRRAETKPCAPVVVAGPWSEPDSPSRWAKVFRVSPKTFKRHVETGAILAKKLSDRSYQVAVAALPSGRK